MTLHESSPRKHCVRKDDEQRNPYGFKIDAPVVARLSRSR
jgi:hypothetical protein